MSTRRSSCPSVRKSARPPVRKKRKADDRESAHLSVRRKSRTHRQAETDPRIVLHLESREVVYQKLFLDVLEDGIITPEEQRQLDAMTDRFRLDPKRLQKIEIALQASYVTHRRIVVRDLSSGYARDPDRSARGQRFVVEHGRHGFSAVLFDRRGRSVNAIHGDSERHVRTAAKKYWPNAKETKIVLLRDRR